VGWWLPRPLRVLPRERVACLLDGRQLPFLAIRRVRDAATLAYCKSTEDPEVLLIFQKLLGAAAQKLSPGHRLRLQWHEGSVCCMMDAQGMCLYCVVTAQVSYPEMLAQQLLGDLQREVSDELVAEALDALPELGLHARLGAKLTELIAHYELPENFPRYALQLSRQSLVQVAPPAESTTEPDHRRRNLLVFSLVIVLVFAGFLYASTWLARPRLSTDGFLKGIVLPQVGEQASEAFAKPASTLMI